MFWKVGILVLFIWVIIGAWVFEPPMGGVQNPDVYRIFYFHVPVAMVTFIAYALAMYQGIMYLNKKDLKYDKRSSTAAVTGPLNNNARATTGMLSRTSRLFMTHLLR